MTKQKISEYNSHAVGVLIDLPEGSAVKFVAHRGYDALLCNHVYMRFCPNCPQYKCRKKKYRYVYTKGVKSILRWDG